MRAITLHHPWPWAVCELGCPVVELPRSPGLELGELVAVHGARLPTTRTEWDVVLEILLWMRSRGLVRDVVDLRATCEPYCGVVAVAAFDGAAEAADSPWHVGPLGIYLRDVRRTTPPVRCRGERGLWELPDDVLQRVLTRLKETR